MIKRVECINGEMTDLRFCDNCGDEIPELVHHYWGDERGDFCCLECFVKDNKDWEDTLTTINAKLVGSNNAQKVMLDEFIYTVFDQQQIEDILYKEFSQLPEAEQTEYIRKYAEEDEYSWLRYLKDFKDKSAEIILNGEVI